MSRGSVRGSCEETGERILGRKLKACDAGHQALQPAPSLVRKALEKSLRELWNVFSLVMTSEAQAQILAWENKKPTIDLGLVSVTWTPRGWGSPQCLAGRPRWRHGSLGTRLPSQFVSPAGKRQCGLYLDLAPGAMRRSRQKKTRQKLTDQGNFKWEGPAREH